MRSSKKVDLSVVSGFWGGAYAPDAPPLATGLGTYAVRGLELKGFTLTTPIRHINVK